MGENVRIRRNARDGQIIYISFENKSYIVTCIAGTLSMSTKDIFDLKPIHPLEIPGINVYNYYRHGIISVRSLIDGDWILEGEEWRKL